MTKKIDVLVIGAGPAGSVAASMIHQSGLSVMVVEREKFPRFVIGESLLPRSGIFQPLRYNDGPGAIFDPSLNRDKRNRVRSCPGSLPITKSATTRPIPGPMPKPCPLIPVAITRPGIAAAWSITGTISGIVSIIPAQTVRSFGRPKAGKAFAKLVCTRPIVCMFGFGSKTRMRSNDQFE